MAEAVLIAGTLMSAGSTILGGSSQAKGLKSEAAQLEYNAGQERASSQRKAMEERRAARLTNSRALALAAASGGGADDPSVINLMADTETEGEYRALTALWEGDQAGRDLERQATVKRREAKTVKTQSYLNAGGTLLQGGTSLYDRYGGGGVKAGGGA